MTPILSLTVRSWRDAQTGTMRLRVTRVDSGTDVPLAEGAFLLRVTTEDNGAVHRCCIRHIVSGREAYVQGGPELWAFVADCLFPGEREVAGRPDAPGDG